MASGTKKDGVTKEDVLAALSRVKEPELGRDLVSLNMIKDVAVCDGQVSFTVVLTTPACPLVNQIKAEAEAAVKALPGVSAVTVKTEANVAKSAALWNTDMLPGVAHPIAVGSGKGGVGKSTVAVNLAVALAEMGAKVGILDADITGPNIPLMMGVNEPPTVEGEKIVPLFNHGVKIMSIGFLVPEDTPVIWRAPLVSKAIQQFLYDVAWGELDYLIIDLPPGTGDAALTAAQAVPLSGAVIVVTPQEVALQDARKQTNMFRKVEVPILGIVENMSYFLCPHCGQRTEIFSHGGGEQAAQKMGVPFLGAVPLDPRIRMGSDTGQPMIIAEPVSPQAEAFRTIARNVAARLSVLSYQKKRRTELLQQRAIPLEAV